VTICVFGFYVVGTGFSMVVRIQERITGIPPTLWNELELNGTERERKEKGTTCFAYLIASGSAKQKPTPYEDLIGLILLGRLEIFSRCLRTKASRARLE
jgi:hypothetical protein